jgi:hypothetical protein
VGAKGDEPKMQSVQKGTNEPGLVGHSCNSSYTGGGRIRNLDASLGS